MKTGLVLEGGAMRGLFSAGIIDVLMENDVQFDGIVGVSAGAAFGCNMKSRQAGRAIRYNTKFANDWRYCSLRSLLTTGDIFGGEFCYHYLPKHLDIFDNEAFNNNPQEFFAVCTDVETGEPIYKRLMKADDECYEWIRASASMPLASKIVNINGRKVLDGGISDSIPLKFMQQQGYEKNIVVTTQPAGYVKEKNSFLPLMRLQLRRYPRFLDAVANRHEMYNAQLEYVAEQERQGKTLVLRPESALTIGHITHDADKMWETYNIGRALAEKRLEEIKEYVAPPLSPLREEIM
ncbi:MAG: patatin family protein [Prevotella sp.]|nr:patatin family protein [Prevotella sp.]